MSVLAVCLFFEFILLKIEDLNDSYAPPPGPRHGGADGGGAPRGAKGGFSVKGGPWEPGAPVVAPNTMDTEEFPSMGPGANSGDALGTPWGPRYGNSK